MNFVWVIIGAVYLIYQFSKEHKGEGFLAPTLIMLGVLVAVIAVPQLIGASVGGEEGRLLGGIIGFSALFILIIVFFIGGYKQ